MTEGSVLTRQKAGDRRQETGGLRGLHGTRVLCAIGVLGVALLLGGGARAAEAPDPPARTYYVYAAAESDDEVAIVRYGPDGAELGKTSTVGSVPAEVEGPHGLNVYPDGRHWSVSIAHGFPYCSLH